jgi:hypothetical protein
MIVAVFDCVVYVQAALSRRGPAFACLQVAEAEHVILHLSPDIIEEVRQTLAAIYKYKEEKGRWPCNPATDLVPQYLPALPLADHGLRYELPSIREDRPSENSGDHCAHMIA